MILGSVTSDGLPVVMLPMAGQTWRAIVDTGFNGDLELPEALRPFVNPRFKGQFHSLLAGGQSLVEDTYQVALLFDGQTIVAEATFVSGSEILIGTNLLREYRLEIDFPAKTVQLQRMV